VNNGTLEESVSTFQGLPVETETTATIPPFVFVDGRKYILADAEELPEPEIFARLTPPPRNVSQLVQWRLLLCRESDMLMIAIFIGALCGYGLGMLFIDSFEFVGFIMAGIIFPMSFFVISALFRIRSTVRNRSKIVHLLQNGFVGKGRFVGMRSTGKTVDNFTEVELKYQFTAEDGNTRNAFIFVTEMYQLITLSSESLKLIFYDPAGPSRNLLFDTLPKGIKFDEDTGTFCTSPLLLMGQIVGLCIAMAAIPVIIFGVYMFLC